MFEKRGATPGIVDALEETRLHALHGMRTRNAARFTNIFKIYLEAEYILGECAKEEYVEAGERYFAHAVYILASQKNPWQAVLQ